MIQKPDPPGAFDPYLPGDKIPVAEATELSSAEAFEAWSALHDVHQAQFANTALIADLPPDADPKYAPTEPVGLRRVQEAPPPRLPKPTVSLEDAMVEARRFNRVCPQPAKWHELHAMLPRAATAASQPSAPLPAAIWKATPALAKRMVFREHLEWADSHGVLPEVYAFLQSLPEEQWHHMGE